MHSSHIIKEKFLPIQIVTFNIGPKYISTYNNKILEKYWLFFSQFKRIAIFFPKKLDRWIRAQYMSPYDLHNDMDFPPLPGQTAVR